MAQEMNLKLDMSDFNAATQLLKHGIERFCAAKIDLVQENGKVLSTTGVQQLAKKNQGVANILKHLTLLAADFGGELVFTDPEETPKSMRELGFCGVPEPYGSDRVCSFDPDHKGDHSWLS